MKQEEYIEKLISMTEKGEDTLSPQAKKDLGEIKRILVTPDNLSKVIRHIVRLKNADQEEYMQLARDAFNHYLESLNLSSVQITEDHRNMFINTYAIAQRRMINTLHSFLNPGG